MFWAYTQILWYIFFFQYKYWLSKFEYNLGLQDAQFFQHCYDIFIGKTRQEFKYFIYYDQWLFLHRTLDDHRLWIFNFCKVVISISIYSSYIYPWNFDCCMFFYFFFLLEVGHMARVFLGSEVNCLNECKIHMLCIALRFHEKLELIMIVTCIKCLYHDLFLEQNPLEKKKGCNIC